jgi:hypothetical protein
MFDSNDPFGGFQMGGGNKPAAPQGMQVGGGSSPFPTSAPTQSGEQKYQILNLFWLINPKAYAQDAKYLEGEVHFCTISYNVNFGNLRIELCNMTNESIVGQMICLNKVSRLVSATMYPTAMFQVVSGIPEIYCMEQIITYTNSDWQNKLKPAKVVQSETGIILSVENLCYEFSNWQKEAFLYACKFALNQGLILSGENLKK